MARRWYNEDFRKLYTRQDGPWLALPFCARGLAADLLRYADDRGVVAIVGEGEEEGDAIAAVVRAKFDERETMIRAVKALRAEGYLARKGDRLLIKNFVAAQQRLSQEAARAQRARDKKATDGVTVEGVTEGGRGRDVGRDESVTSDPPNVTQKFAVSRRDETRREEPPPARAGGGSSRLVSSRLDTANFCVTFGGSLVTLSSRPTSRPRPPSVTPSTVTPSVAFLSRARCARAASCESRCCAATKFLIRSRSPLRAR